MKLPKDRFSEQASAYQQFRPSYPPALIGEITTLVNHHEYCWDCGTGNGQVASLLAPYFKRVYASDISETQLAAAPALENVEYMVARAAQTPFADNQFDLVTVAQAVHWFDLENFYTEATRVLKDQGVLAIWGYGLLQISTEIDQLIRGFYKDVVGPFWDPERRHIETEYRSIRFPYDNIQLNEQYAIRVRWGLEQLKGYLSSWSSVRRYMAEFEADPVPAFIGKLKDLWPENESYQVEFPIFSRIGRIQKTER